MQILKSRLAVILLALILGFGISNIHHTYHEKTEVNGKWLDSAITVCKSVFD